MIEIGLWGFVSLREWELLDLILTEISSFLCCSLAGFPGRGPKVYGAHGKVTRKQAGDKSAEWAGHACGLSFTDAILFLTESK